MTKQDTQPEPPQDGDLTDWVADSLVYIQNTTTNLVRDFGNFQDRMEASFDGIKNQAGGKQFDQALGLLQRATEDFNKTGHEADMKRRALGTWPIAGLGVGLIIAMVAQTAFLSGGFDGFAYFGLTEQNRAALDKCIQAVKENSTAYRCTLVIRPKDL